MKNKQELFAPVWRHWKKAFHEYRWLIIYTTVAYGTTTYLNDVYKATVWKRIIDTLSEHKDPRELFLLIPTIGIVSWFLNRIGDWCLTKAESNIIRYLKNYALSKILTYDTNFFLNTFTGSIVAKAKRFAATTESVCDEYEFVILRVAVVLSGIFIVALNVLPIAGIILLSWAVVFGCVSLYISKLRTPFDLESAKADSHTTGSLSDVVGSIHMIHSYTREEAEYEHFVDVTNIENKKRMTSWLRGNLQWAVQAILVMILEISLMYLVISKARHGEVSVGTVMLVQSFVASVSGYMWAFGKSLTRVRTSFADACEMADIINEREKDVLGNTENETYVSIDVLEKYNIDFSHVSFSYPEGNSIVLNDISFNLESGKRYGIVGATGSGKTTITRLLLRQFELTQNNGHINICGISISDFSKHDVRRLISYVPQDPHFPYRTVKEIIAFGNPSATDEEIIVAAKKAACHDFIVEHLEYGYETKVGEMGVKLSGGQRQRLAIAAAFLKDAPIFIFDEPTSALDAETEELIQYVLKNMKGKTMIVIAHRLSTVAELDEILVLEKGVFVERGTHKELIIKNEGTYAKFWNKQFFILN